MNIHGVETLEDFQIESPAFNCSFYTFGHYSDGFCTFFGACRVDSIDYMYRGVCGQLSNWGEKKINHLEVRKALDISDRLINSLPSNLVMCGWKRYS